MLKLGAVHFVSVLRMYVDMLQILVVSVAALAAGITTDDGSAAKRTVDLLQGMRTFAQSRRIQAGPAPAQNHYQTARRRRPSLPLPPYAVQMEPLVQYSQRDPLYHQQQQQPDNLTRDNSIDEKVRTCVLMPIHYLQSYTLQRNPCPITSYNLHALAMKTISYRRSCRFMNHTSV